MKKISGIILFLTVLFAACDTPDEKKEPASKTEDTTQTSKIKVGVFDKNGDSPYCITDALEALKIDKDIEPVIFSAADVIKGVTDNFDVLLFPGGGGRSETGSLGELGQQKVIQFVKEKGKAVIGICAGAYILSTTPGYPSLHLSGGEAIDIEHDHRGHGLAKFSLTEKGKTIFPELADRTNCYSQYYEGPVLIPAKDSEQPYTELATMLSDVHTVEGTPADMTNNRPFIIINKVGKGQTASFVGHPESTPGMRWMIPRIVRILTGKKIVTYPSNVVRPDIYTQEILFTKDRLAQQRQAYDALIKSKEEKMKAMQELVEMSAWSAKKYIPPMVRDSDFEVRLLAAKLTVSLERTDAIKDLEAAVYAEKNEDQKRQLQEQLNALKNILGENN